MNTNLVYNNIYNVLNLASDEHFDNGLSWYDDAREFCRMLSIETNKPMIAICAALAALSPRNKWERNKQDLKALCYGDDMHKFGTFKAMVNKAKHVLTLTNREDILEALNGPKICAFFDNIYDENSQMVTVDFHMHHIAIGHVMPEDERPNLNKSDYDMIQKTIESIAEQQKLRPYELQAILWVTWRDYANTL